MKKSAIGLFLAFALMYSTAAAKVPLNPASVATDIVAPQDEEKAKPPRTFAVGFQTGLLGRMGFELKLALSNTLSLVPGAGGWLINEQIGNNTQYREEFNTCLLLRWGKTFYVGTGYVAMNKNETVRIGDLSAGGQASSAGVPVFVGFETASRKGSFLRLEAGCIYYTSRSEDIIFNNPPLQLTLSAPGATTFSGVAVGRYLK